MSPMKTYFGQPFQVFLEEAPEFAQAWLQGINGLQEASALDEKTEALVGLALMAVAGMTGAVPFFVKKAREIGASRDEVTSAVLAGLPWVGSKVALVLPEALQAYDGQ